MLVMSVKSIKNCRSSIHELEKMDQPINREAFLKGYKDGSLDERQKVMTIVHSELLSQVIEKKQQIAH